MLELVARSIVRPGFEYQLAIVDIECELYNEFFDHVKERACLPRLREIFAIDPVLISSVAHGDGSSFLIFEFDHHICPSFLRGYFDSFVFPLLAQPALEATNRSGRLVPLARAA